MELDWIETFLAVVDRGGFTAASSQVHRSQSRVSAHIAALERELSVQLIDRTRRPATLTPSGRIFAEHARDIMATVGSARSAIDVLRSIHEETLAVVTSPGWGASLFPGVLAQVLDRHPHARVVLAEHGRLDTDPPQTGVLAVVATRPPPHPAGLREQVLWREPIMAVIPADHPQARTCGPTGRAIAIDWLVAQDLVVGSGPVGTEPDFAAMMAKAGVEITPRMTVDSVHTLVALVRQGVGVGLANAVSLEAVDTTGLVVLELDDPEMFREVAVYWSDAVLSTEVGRSLHKAVLQAPLPKGAIGMSRSGERYSARRPGS